MTHLTPADDADFAMASDLGRKADHDATEAIFRTMALGETPYQRQVIVLAGAVAALGAAKASVRLNTPEATSRDLVEALLEMMEARNDEDR